MNYVETEYGFEYGAAKIERLLSNEKEGWVVIGIETPKYSGPAGLQIYVTKTGKIRISPGKWMPPEQEKNNGS